MKLTPWCIAAVAPIAAAGCSGAFVGHVAVLAVAIGIFVGTLSLGRTRGSLQLEGGAPGEDDPNLKPDC